MPEDESAEDFQLLEGWMLGVLMFPLAMEEIIRIPAANDAE